jgi:hypothetical protein
MSAEYTALKQAYEVESMSPAEIAEDRGLDIVAVKAALMQCSTKYRRDCNKEDESVSILNVSDDEAMRLKESLLTLALAAENEGVRAKTAMFLFNEKKGRNDIVKGMAQQNNNIFLINQHLSRVREAASRVIKDATVIA